MSDITKQSLTELVKNIKDKKLSSTEVTKAFIDRSEKSKELNAYVTEDFTSADVKSSVTYAFNSLDFSDLSMNALVTSVEDSFLSLIFLTNSVRDCFVISDITLSPLVQQNNLHYLEENF